MFAYIMCGDCSVYLANQCQCPFWRLVSLGGLHHYLVHYNHRIMALLRTILRKTNQGARIYLGAKRKGTEKRTDIVSILGATVIMITLCICANIV